MVHSQGTQRFLLLPDHALSYGIVIAQSTCQINTQKYVHNHSTFALSSTMDNTHFHYTANATVRQDDKTRERVRNGADHRTVRAYGKTSSVSARYKRGNRCITRCYTPHTLVGVPSIMCKKSPSSSYTILACSPEIDASMPITVPLDSCEKAIVLVCRRPRVAPLLPTINRLPCMAVTIKVKTEKRGNNRQPRTVGTEVDRK